MADSKFIREEFPGPIASAVSGVESAADPVARFHHLIELAEESARYLSLVALARYLEVRQAGRGTPELELGLRLSQPSFGSWVESLARLESHLRGIESPLFEVGLDAPLDIPGATSLLAVTDGSGRGGKPTAIRLLRSLVSLRNRTKGHGTISESQAQEKNGPLRDGLLALLTALPILASRAPVLVQNIEYHNTDCFMIRILPLIGTGWQVPESFGVREPGVLKPDNIYLWDRRGSPLLLTPLAYALDGALLLLEGVVGRTPQYTSCQRPGVRHVADNLRLTFEERAAFLLAPVRSGATASRPPGALDAYSKLVAQAAKDGVVTGDEFDLLKTAAAAMGLTEEEAGSVHRRYALADGPAKPPAHDIPLPVEPSRLSAPKSDDPELEAARRLDRSDDFDGALAAFRGLLERNPRHHVARAELARLLLELSEHAAAERVCLDGLGMEESGPVHASLSAVYLDWNRSVDAHHHAQRAVEMAPSDYLSHLALAACHELDGNETEKGAHYTLALQVAPKEPLVAASWATSLRDKRAGLKEIDRALCRDPKNRTIRAIYAGQLLQLDRLEDALVELTALCRRAPRSHLYLSVHSLCLSSIDVAAARECADKALALYPESLFGGIARAMYLALQGDFSGSRDVIVAVQRRNHRLPTVVLLVVRTLSIIGDHRAAANEARSFLELNPDSQDLRLILAECLRSLGEEENALREIRRVLSLDPGSDAAKAALATALIDLCRWDEAKVVLEEAGGSTAVLLARGALALAMEDLQAAESFHSEVWQRGCNNTTAGQSLIAIYGRQQRLDAAERTFREAKVRWPALQVAMARAYEECGDHRQAIGMLDMLTSASLIVVWSDASLAAGDLGARELQLQFARRSIELHPDSFDAHFGLAMALDASGDADGAIRSYRRVLQLNKSHLRAWNNLAILLGNKGAAEEALEAMQNMRALPGADKNPVCRVNYAHLLLRMGKVDDALAEGRDALALPGGEPLRLEWAQALADTKGEASLELISEGLILHPQNIDLRRARSVTFSKMGKPEEALRELREAERLAPKNPYVHLDLGILLGSVGRHRQALLSLKRARSLAPSDESVARSYALALIASGELDEACRLFEQVLQQTQTADDLLTEWFMALITAGQLNYALDLARELKGKRPEKATLIGYEGELLHRLGRQEEALPLLQRVASRKNTKVNFPLARCLMALERWSEAEEALRTAIEHYPDGENYRALFDCLIRLKDPEARDVLNKIRTLEPNAADLEQLSAMLPPT